MQAQLATQGNAIGTAVGVQVCHAAGPAPDGTDECHDHVVLERGCQAVSRQASPLAELDRGIAGFIERVVQTSPKPGGILTALLNMDRPFD